MRVGEREGAGTGKRMAKHVPKYARVQIFKRSQGSAQNVPASKFNMTTRETEKETDSQAEMKMETEEESETETETETETEQRQQSQPKKLTSANFSLDFLCFGASAAFTFTLAETQ